MTEENQLSNLHELTQEELEQLPSDGEIREFIESQTGGREIDVDCDAALEDGWDLDTCLNPRGTMQMIACVANRLQNGDTASQAWRAAWISAEQNCRDLGARLRDLTGASTVAQNSCNEVWQKVGELGLDEMAQRNAEISENEGKEVGNRVCDISDGLPTIGTEQGLTMAPCTGEEIADHHHHASQGGGNTAFSSLDIASMVGRDLDISCITYPDGDDMMMKCANVEIVDEEVSESLQEAWDDYFPDGSMSDLTAAYDEIEDARNQLQTCTAEMPQMASQEDLENLFNTE